MTDSKQSYSAKELKEAMNALIAKYNPNPWDDFLNDKTPEDTEKRMKEVMNNVNREMREIYK